MLNCNQLKEFFKDFGDTANTRKSWVLSLRHYGKLWD